MCVLVVACGGSRVSVRGATVTDVSGLAINRPVVRSDLVHLPAARLRFPGSSVVKMVGEDQTPTQPGEEPNPAFTGAILTADTSPSALYRWYGSELAKRGFAPAPDFRPADQTSAQAWQSHHRLEVQVGVFDPVLLRRYAGIQVSLSPGELVYEAVVVGYPPGLPRY
jgi:hypothetical protein